MCMGDEASFQSGAPACGDSTIGRRRVFQKCREGAAVNVHGGQRGDEQKWDLFYFTWQAQLYVEQVRMETRCQSGTRS
eukprot:4453025-Pleurochrysis_carterae.AAC.1